MRKKWAVRLGLVLMVAVVAVLLTAPSLRRKAEAVKCGNQMIAIGYAAHSWADDNGERLPPGLSSMSNEIIALQLVICPSDTASWLAESWSSLTTNNASYQLVSAGETLGTNREFLRCPIHGFILRADGTVYDGDKPLTKRVL